MTEHLKLISTPDGYECETEFGLFQTSQSWKARARLELAEWIAAQRETEEAA